MNGVQTRYLIAVARLSSPPSQPNTMRCRRERPYVPSEPAVGDDQRPAPAGSLSAVGKDESP
jgi:hypothetical protein